MEVITYLFKVNLAIVIFCLIYRIFYRKDTFFSVRRYLLQVILLLSVVYPFIDFSYWMVGSETMADMVLSYKNVLPEIAVYTDTNFLATDGLIVAPRSFLNYLLWFYVVGVCFLLLRILFRAMQIVWLRRHSKSVFVEGVRVNRLSTEVTPFSFFSWVFVNTDMYDERELHEVMAHEMVHVRQRHSVDILIAELVCAFCWINPLVWMLKKEIRWNLEFIVDSCVIDQSGIDIKSYQYSLLKLACYSSKMMLVNQFNISPLKERIMMINVKKSPKIKLATYTFVFPIVLLLLVINNVHAVADRINKTEAVKNVVVEDMPKCTAYELVLDSDSELEDQVFISVEKMPEFPGGEVALLKYIADNVNYPIIAAKNGIQGRVTCTFVVNIDGSVTEVQVVRPNDQHLDAEAIRVLQILPKFNPGMQGGKPVRVKYSVPVRFRLNN